MSWYFVPVALLVFCCYRVDSKGPVGEYKKVTEKNYRQLGYNGTLEFRGNDDISITLTTENKDKTMDLAINLTERADRVLSFDVEYGVQSRKCLNTTTTKFHFGEQYGLWASDSTYFRVMMMQGTVDPVVPFDLGKNLQITVKRSSAVLTVTCGAEHNWANGSVVDSEPFNKSTLYTPKFYLDSWSETGKECTRHDHRLVKVILHNAEVWTKAGQTPSAPKVLKNLTVAFPNIKSRATDEVHKLLLNLATLWTDELNKTLVVSLIPYADKPWTKLIGPYREVEELTSAINEAFGHSKNGTQPIPSQKRAVTAYANRNPTKGDYFFLVAPDFNDYNGGKKARKQDTKEVGKILKEKNVLSKISKAAAGGPNLEQGKVSEYGSLTNLGGANLKQIVAYFKE